MKTGQPTRVMVPGGMLRVRNADQERAFRGRYRQEWYTLPPNSEAFLEYGAIVTWLGNPFVVDGPKDKERTREFHRIKMMHCGSEHLYDDAYWLANKPNLECFTMEGKRFYTVADDPRGETIIDPTNEDDPRRLNQQFVQMQAILQMMAAKMKASGIDVDLPDLLEQPVIPTPSDDPNRSGTLNAPIVLGPDNSIKAEEEPDEWGSDDLIPTNNADALRKVDMVEIDNPKLVQVSQGKVRTSRRQQQLADLGDDDS